MAIQLSVRVVTPRAVARAAPTQPAADRRRYADQQTMRKTLAAGASALLIALTGCGGRYEDRAFFVKGHGIGITDPQPDKDGTWWMAIEHETAIMHSGQYVQRWDAAVHDDKIAIRAFVVVAGSLTRQWYGRPERGAHIDELREGEYQVVYRDQDGKESSLGHVTARRSDYVPEPTWLWSGGRRHNSRLNPPVGPVTTFANDARVAPAPSAG